MTRFNPNNKGHRKTLATRIEKMLVSSGFSVDASHKGEVVYERAVDGTNARVRVLTSIVGGEVRQKGTDAIRVCAVVDIAGETKGLVKSTRVNRTGDMGGITNRLLTAMRKTYKAAQTRAKDQSFLAGLTGQAKPAPAKKPARKPASAARLNAAVKKKAEAPVEKVDSSFGVGALVKFTAGDYLINHVGGSVLGSLPKSVRNHVAIVTSPGSNPVIRWMSGPRVGQRDTLTKYVLDKWVVSVLARPA
jgi:hypothetical protein